MTHEMMQSLFDTYVAENEKFESGNKLAGTRARKATGRNRKLTKVRRKEIQDAKNTDK